MQAPGFPVKDFKMMSWMRSNCRKAANCTHLSMGQEKGSFTVPSSLEEVFLIKYSRAVAGGEPLSLTEVKTPTFHLFADLDWIDPIGSPVEEGKQLEVAKFVSQQAFLIFAPATSEHAVVVATRQPVCNKTGMHIHWPGILACSQSARIFRQTAVERCRERFGEGYMGSKAWEDVIDESVYKGSGLRMLYSCKQVPEDVYRPKWCLTVELQDIGSLKQAIIKEVNALELNQGAESVQHWVETCTVRYRGFGKTQLQECVEELKEDNSNPKEALALQEHEAGLRALQQVLPECYRSCQFVKLVRGDNKAFITPNTKVCLNLEPGRDGQPQSHRNNNVYFVVDRTSTYQACFCNCETVEGRVRGPCKDFKSNHFPTPPELADSLFPLPAVPFSCGGITFTKMEATSSDIFDRFFKPRPPPMKKKARRAKK